MEESEKQLELAKVWLSSTLRSTVLLRMESRDYGKIWLDHVKVLILLVEICEMNCGLCDMNCGLHLD